MITVSKSRTTEKMTESRSRWMPCRNKRSSIRNGFQKKNRSMKLWQRRYLTWENLRTHMSRIISEFDHGRIISKGLSTKIIHGWETGAKRESCSHKFSTISTSICNHNVSTLYRAFDSRGSFSLITNISHRQISLIQCLKL